MYPLMSKALKPMPSPPATDHAMREGIYYTRVTAAASFTLVDGKTRSQAHKNGGWGGQSQEIPPGRPAGQNWSIRRGAGNRTSRLPFQSSRPHFFVEV
jgi:hypothetical protein